jgi:hypothetical protein
VIQESLRRACKRNESISPEKFARYRDLAPSKNFSQPDLVNLLGRTRILDQVDVNPASGGIAGVDTLSLEIFKRAHR